MVKVIVELTFNEEDITTIKAWWKENGFSDHSTDEIVLTTAALNGIGSPEFIIVSGSQE